jgi:hypothetical protein
MSIQFWLGFAGWWASYIARTTAHKVRRGLSGRVGQGLNAGGRAYGYAPIAGDKGKRTIVEDEAQIIRRIFEEYIGGRTPREIAHDLDNEGIAPPRGARVERLDNQWQYATRHHITCYRANSGVVPVVLECSWAPERPTRRKRLPEQGSGSVGKGGSGRGTRTPDPRIMIPVL